ncbi:MAG: hypothetical protein AAFY88_21420 [Acidobacteriota bacterium]
MKQRVEVGTDIAQIGAWDESRIGDPLPDLRLPQLEEVLAADSRRGDLFVLQLEGDWGGPVDVYVNAPIDPEHFELLQRLPGDHQLSVPSGRIVVGGVEDYRSTEPQITSESSIVEVPAGEYGLQAYALKPEHAESSAGPDPDDIRKIVGDELYAHFERSTREKARGLLLLLLFFPLWLWGGLLTATLLSIALCLGYLFVQDKRHRRDPQFLEAEKVVQATRTLLGLGLPARLSQLQETEDHGDAVYLGRRDIQGRGRY